MVNVSGWSQGAVLPTRAHREGGDEVLASALDGTGLHFDLPVQEVILGDGESGSAEGPVDTPSMMLPDDSSLLVMGQQGAAGDVVADHQLVEVERALRQFDNQQVMNVGVLAGSEQEAFQQALPPVIAMGRSGLAPDAGQWLLPRVIPALTGQGARPISDPMPVPSIGASDVEGSARTVLADSSQLVAANEDGQFAKAAHAESHIVRPSAAPPGIVMVATAGSLGAINVAEAGNAQTVAQLADARWGEQFVRTLQEQVQLQVRQGMQTATIRLDPPELGQVEIRVSHEQGRLQVQIHAAQPDVARLLNLMGDRLRTDLLAQQFEQVELKFGAGDGQGREGRGRGGENRPDPVLANVLSDPTGEARHAPRDDLLISV